MSLITGDSIGMEKPEWLTQMETALEVLNEGVIIADDRQRILFANSQFLEMTGIPRQDLIGFDPSSFYSSQEMDFLRQQIDVAFRAGHNRYAFVLPRKGGGRLPVIISSRMLENSLGKFGIEGVQEIVRQTSSLPPHEMKQGILDGVAAWPEGPQADDVSLMLVHVS